MPPEVMDALGPWGQFGLIVTCVALIITGFSKGWLFTSTSVEWQNKHLEGRLTDKDDIIKELKATNAALAEVNAVQARSIQELLEIGRTTNAALTALPRVEVDK